MTVQDYLLKFRKISSLESLEKLYDHLNYTLTDDQELINMYRAADHRRAELVSGFLLYCLKYKNNPEKMNQEVMKLYKDNNVSMVGGCLPTLLPLPILMALYWVFMGINLPDGQVASFLWIKDVFAPDPYYILPVLAALSTYLPSYLMTKSTPQQENGMNMGTMNLVMAGMMGFMALNFKSILVLYWIIGNIIQMVQTYFLNYRPAMEEAKIIEKKETEVNDKKEKFVMNVEQPKNLASKKKKKKK